ncbi:plant cysteine oxidase 2-like isoform X2 [Cornus florida]|uniref:plant cysteine oxidase 2-like isoform X2 n=1 Tax=Cornus florida TaxID=4283 RepID=UPI00289849AC|nr:plant cysteine oxidase 2-like isoform X2 [Cornus florida]
MKETNSRSKRSRRRQKKMSAVQKLYETCKEVFASGGTGVVPPESDIERLKSILDTMTEKDVGLRPNMPYFRKKTDDPVNNITYLQVHECDKFSIGIFCLPPSGAIPLHNHPGMTVFSKLLFGTVHVKSYDWVKDDVPGNTIADSNHLDIKHPKLQLAKVKVNSEFTAPCNTSILYPADGGNMHCFTAVTACAVLDVLGPPYSDPNGRHCTYYLDFPFSSHAVDGVTVPEEETEGHAWLQERDYPEDFRMVGKVYSGPRIVEN